MNIILLNSALGQGITTRLLVKLSKRYRKNGHSAVVWGLYKEGDTYLSENETQYLFEDKPKLYEIPLLIIRLINSLNKIKPDVLFCSLPFANIIGSLAANFTSIPHVIAIHHGTFPDYSSLFFRSRIEILLSNLGLFDKQICVSKAVQKSYSSLLNKKRLAVIHNATDLKVSSLEKKAARNRFKLPKESFLIISVGRLSKEKNHDFLLNVVSRLPDCELAICGGGMLENDLRKKANGLNIENKVHLLGYVEPDEIPDFLKTGDLFAFPSIHEGFGLAVVEAMKSGLPIIASNIPTLKEVVNSAGILLPLEQSKWVEEIQTLKGNQELLDDYSKKSLEHSEKFSFEKMAEQYLAVARGELV